MRGFYAYEQASASLKRANVCILTQRFFYM